MSFFAILEIVESHLQAGTETDSVLGASSYNPAIQHSWDKGGSVRRDMPCKLHYISR